ncbi:ABC transporter permease subunit [Clostridium felsineum]|nr:ABC transporter permease subunit [Clostridium felsineum]
MLLPTILFFIVLAYIPMAGVYYAFTDYDFSKGLFGSRFVGLKNFAFLFSGGSHAIIWTITKNTVVYNLEFLILTTITQVAMAIIINELPGKLLTKFCQTLMFLPYFVSFVIVAVFVYNIFNYDYGILNNIIKMFGGKPINYYNTPGAWKYILNGVNMWKSLGYGTVMYLAALTAVDRSIYEAAAIDGANIFQRIRYITLPSIRPTIVILILFSIGGIVKGQFDMFYNIIGKNGLLYNATDIIDTYVYRTLTVNFNLGIGTAAGLYQSVLGLILVLIVNKIVKIIEPDYALF